MPHWLSAAGKAFQRRPVKEPQRFELRCLCGTALAGDRAESYQRLICPNCQTPHFVLPASVYPAPRMPKPAKPKQDAPTPAPLPIVPQRVIESVPPVRRSRSTPAPAPSRPAPEPALVRNSAGQWLTRKCLTPVRLVLLSVLCVVGGTAYWMAHTRAIQNAQVEFASASKRGQDALSRKDFATAAEELEVACLALDRLGRDDPPARIIRQQRRECQAASHLVLKSLHELLDEAVAENSTAMGWSETFRALYKDSWMVFETTITRTNELPPASRFRVDFPILSGQQRAVLLADVKVFDGLPTEQPSQRVIFAAQLEDFRRDPQSANTWQIVLRPDSAFLWSGADSYQALDVVLDAQSTKTLAEQTALLGITR